MLATGGWQLGRFPSSGSTAEAAAGDRKSSGRACSHCLPLPGTRGPTAATYLRSGSLPSSAWPGLRRPLKLAAHRRLRSNRDPPALRCPGSLVAQPSSPWPLLPPTRLQLLATPGRAPSAPAPGASPAPDPPHRPAPKHTPISARDPAPRTRAAPSASTSLRAGDQGPAALGAYRPYPQSPPPPPSPPPPARGRPRRPDGGRSPLRSSTSARLGLVRLRGVSRARQGVEVGTQGKVEDKFWPPGIRLATCSLRDPAPFEHTRVSEAVARVRRTQMPRLTKEGRPCNSWPRQHSFPSGQKNRATRRGTPGVKEG